jgi:C1A family cysteine protease/alpha-tubulin suppressor-like RCC1 family protein/O-glycosyl hydrolase
VKSNIRAVLTLTAVFSSFLLAAGGSFASPSTSLTIAPVNPEFVVWQNKAANSKIAFDAQGHFLGEIPSPIDRSHLLNQASVLPSPLDGLPASYDLRTFGYVTSVKNQGGCGSCWTFGTYGSLESWLLKNASETWDFSENHLKNYHGFDWAPCYGGNADMSTAYLARWSGPVSEADDPYHDYDDRPSPGGIQRKIVDKVLWFFTTSDIKNAIMTYGGLYVTFYWGSAYYNSTENTYYYNGSNSGNHAVTLIGWDDNKVVTGAPGNGAWLIKNSWGTGWGANGYFWLSYYDTVGVKYAVAFCDAVPTSSYTTNHQYDPLGMTDAAGYSTTTAWAANYFLSAANEKLKAVGLYAVADNVSYRIFICDDFDGSEFSNVLGYIEGTLANSGYYTIPLASPINLTAGDDFAIVVEFTSPGYNYPIPIEIDIAGYSSGATAEPWQSFVSSTGTEFTDITDISGFENTNVCIRGLAEICPLPGQAGNPNPANLATGVNVTTVLSWTAGSGATSHDVYFGTVSSPPFAGNQAGTTFNPGTLSSCTYYYWRINERNACGAPTGTLWSFRTIAAAPGQATNPSPADSATDVSIDKNLSWTAGNSATSHDVYFGTVSPPPFAGNQPGTTFNPGTLSYRTTYYWRIDEKNACGITTGEQWKFVTSKLQGEIIGWGNNTYGQAGVPLGCTFFTSVSGGYYHSLGLQQSGTILASGRNDYGQCDVPAPNADFNTIAAGGRHSLGLKLDGSIVAWGHNGYGQCDVPAPNTDFVAIAAGYSHSLGLKADGSIVAWGRNDYGQCNVPLPNSGFIAVAAGSYHSLGLKWNGQIVAWGYNAYGQCNVPTPNSGFKAIEGGAYHSLGLKQDGSIVAWGNNGLGQCTVPLPNSGFIAVSGGAYHSMGLKSNGTIVAWGYNTSGQCSVPAPNSNFKAISAGGEHSLGIRPLSLSVYDGNVDYGTVYQQIEGFGAAGAWYEGWLLAHPQKATLYEILFRDLGLDIYRVRNCYGFDGGYINNTNQIVQAAKACNPSLKILNSAWTPPAYLKSNNDTNSYPLPGTLKKDAGDPNNSAPYYYVYNAYANWWADSLTAYESNSIHSDYICIQNEPDLETTYESCKFLPTETSSYAGYDQAFEAVYQKLNSVMGSNMPKMLPPETMGFGGAGVYINALIDVNHAYGFAHHLYNDGSYDYPDSFILGMKNFAALYGYKPLFQTEYERLDSPGDDFAAAMNMALHMYNSLVYEKVCSYFHWTLFWGDAGGLVTVFNPWTNPTYTINPTYYTFKHYAKFTDAGWSVVGSSAVSDDIRITAFKNPASTELTVVIVNKSNNTEEVMLTLNGFSLLNSEIYRSSQTEQWRYLGIFNPLQQLICPGKSITTISMTRKITDCSVALDTGHRLAADLGGAGDCYVNFADFVVMARHWLNSNCATTGNCDGADFEPNGTVNIFDLSEFAEQWLTCNDPENSNCTPNW